MTASTMFSFDEQAHQYKNAAGIIRPSVTQILESVGITDLDGIPGDTLERKRRLGDAVHYATAVIDRHNFFNGPELDWDTLHTDTVQYVLAHEAMMRETGFIPEEVEQSGVASLNGMEFGFTRDRVGKFPGMKYRVVLELKCSYAEEKAWKIQLAAYGLTAKTNGEHIARIACQLKPDGKFKLYPYENPRDIDVFTWALALTTWKVNEGLAWRKENGNQKQTEDTNVKP